MILLVPAWPPLPREIGGVRGHADLSSLDAAAIDINFIVARSRRRAISRGFAAGQMRAASGNDVFRCRFTCRGNRLPAQARPPRRKMCTP